MTDTFDARFRGPNQELQDLGITPRPISGSGSAPDISRSDFFIAFDKALISKGKPLIGSQSLPTPVTRLSDAFDPIKQLVREGFDISNVNILGGYISVKPGEDIQSAIDLLDARGLGGTVFIETGKHSPPGSIDVSPEIELKGSGIDKTVIDFSNDSRSINFKGTLRTIGGTLTVTESSTAVAGSGTTFTNASIGDKILITASDYDFLAEIKTITDDTNIVLVDKYPMATVSGTSGFKVFKSAPNNSISDLTVQNSGAFLKTGYGITTEYTTNFRMNNVKLYDNYDRGFSGLEIFDSIFTNVTAEYNFPTIIGGNGFKIDGARAALFLACSAIGNNGDGFSFSGTSAAVTFVSCISDGNGGDGFDVSGEDSSFFGCRAVGNDDDGFSLAGDRSTISGCLAYKNGGDGVSLDSNSDYMKITGCTLQDNDAWGVDIGSGSFGIVINANYFTGNTSGGINPVNESMIATGNFGISEVEKADGSTMKNTSGGTLVKGDVVILKAVAAGDEITTTTTQGDDKVYGMITTTSVANNAICRVKTTGKVVSLKVDGTTDIAIGDFLGTFTTAGISMKAATGDMAYAYALEAYTTNDSSGVIDALLINPRKI